jgi:hypothetical protein
MPIPVKYLRIDPFRQGSQVLWRVFPKRGELPAFPRVSPGGRRSLLAIFQVPFRQGGAWFIFSRRSSGQSVGIILSMGGNLSKSDIAGDVEKLTKLVIGRARDCRCLPAAL